MKNLVNLGKTLSKNEQKEINGGGGGKFCNSGPVPIGSGVCYNLEFNCWVIYNCSDTCPNGYAPLCNN